MKRPLTRREFLHLLAVGCGTLAFDQLMAGCGQKDSSSFSPPIGTSTASPVSVPTARPTPAIPTQSPAASEQATAVSTNVAEATTPPASNPDLVVARNGEPEEMVRRALKALGGMERFVKTGADVIIKPNICVAYHSYEYAATTNPWVVGALVKLALEAGARRVRVMDYPFGGTPDQAYAISGIQDQVQAAGGEMEIMSTYKFTEVEFPNYLSLKKNKIYEEILNTDVLINVPIAKTHSLSKLTLGMKNLMGTIQSREIMHSDLGLRLTDLASYLRPALTMVDAVRVLIDHGPTGGRLEDVKELNTIIASSDIVAADTYAATLFGMQPQDLSFIKAGSENGLGVSDLNSLNIEEINVGG